MVLVMSSKVLKLAIKLFIIGIPYIIGRSLIILSSMFESLLLYKLAMVILFVGLPLQLMYLSFLSDYDFILRYTFSILFNIPMLISYIYLCNQSEILRFLSFETVVTLNVGLCVCFVLLGSIKYRYMISGIYSVISTIMLYKLSMQQYNNSFGSLNWDCMLTMQLNMINVIIYIVGVLVLMTTYILRKYKQRLIYKIVE